MKKAGVFLFLIFSLVLLYLALPGNYYLRRAIIYQHPQIDQYPIFKNRIVKAGDPQPWPVSPDYNQKAIPESMIPDFEKYGTVAFLIIRDGALLFEEYWQDYSPQSHSNSFSMAKSIVSLAIGCAVDDGFIKEVNQPVSDFYPEFPGYNGKTLTIKHLLTMSAGVNFEEAYTSPFSPTTQLYYGDDLKKVTFQMKEIEEPGTQFIYQSGVTQLLAYIIEKATNETLSSYVSRKLWTPIHAEEDALWSLDQKDRMEKAYCCFNSNARDFARLGQLILNKGSWNGNTLIAPSYIEEAINPDTSLWDPEYNTTNHSYGYQFWRLQYKGYTIPYIRGILGQYIFVIPEKNAVVVRLGHKRSETRTAQHYPDDIDIWLNAALELIN